MSDSSKVVNVRILDKDFRINCPEEKQTSLKQAANYLDTQMRKIRLSGRVIGIERIAVMAALNISHELISLKTAPQSKDNQNLKEQAELTSRLQLLNDKIANALTQVETNQSESLSSELEVTE